MSESMHVSNTITLRLPKFNWQIGALVLVAVIAGFQTVQLMRLKSSITLRPAAASSAAATAPAANNGLESMVGGC